MFCSACGVEIPVDEAAFCYRCGARIAGGASHLTQSAPTEPTVQQPHAIPQTIPTELAELSVGLSSSGKDDRSPGFVDGFQSSSRRFWRTYNGLETRQKVVRGALVIGALAVAIYVIAVIGTWVYSNRWAIAGLLLLVGVIVLLVRSRTASSRAPAVIEGDVLVWQYRSESDFRRDASRLAVKGFEVASVVDQQQRAGARKPKVRILLWRPPARILVTYRRRR